MSPELFAIGKQLRTQDNQCTAKPMFCVQIMKRDVGYDADYATGRCWHQHEDNLTVYDDDKDFSEPEGPDWTEFGYVDRWETVMVAFTKKGCDDYMELDGHNVSHMAFRGKTRIYVHSFNQCREMLAIRKMLITRPTLVLHGFAYYAASALVGVGVAELVRLLIALIVNE